MEIEREGRRLEDVDPPRDFMPVYPDLHSHDKTPSLTSKTNIYGEKLKTMKNIKINQSEPMVRRASPTL